MYPENNLPRAVYSTEVYDKIPYDSRYPLSMIQAIQDQANKGGFAKLHQLKIDTKVMLTINIDIHDRLINGQMGEISNIELLKKASKKYVKFSVTQAGLKTMTTIHLMRQNSWVGIGKSETQFPIKKESTPPSIKRTQFPTAPASNKNNMIAGLLNLLYLKNKWMSLPNFLYTGTDSSKIKVDFKIFNKVCLLFYG